MHYLLTGGHRGITKSYNRVKHKYHWEKLKSDVQRYIQQSLQCQLKKLVRVKIKSTCIIDTRLSYTRIDTRGSSFLIR